MDTLEALSAANETTLTYVADFQKGILDRQREAWASAKSTTSALAGAFPAAPQPIEGRGLLEETFAFQAKLLETQKDFALGLLEVWTPEAPKPTKK